jgi:hypothetical protein
VARLFRGGWAIEARTERGSSDSPRLEIVIEPPQS